MKKIDTIEPILFSIGQTCEMCNVTPRTLRYYEKIGLLRPDRVRDGSGYRYYSMETMERVQIIRYYHEEGFSLDTIREMLDSEDYLGYLDFYRRQIRRTRQSIEEYQKKLYHLKACQALLLEMKDVMQHHRTEIGVRYIPVTECLQYEFAPELQKDSETMHSEGYLTFLGKGLGELSMIDLVGGYSIVFPSYEDRLNNSPQQIRLLQPVYPGSASPQQTVTVGGFQAVTCCHIGPMQRLLETYERMLRWVREHRFTLKGSALERPLWWDFQSGQEEQQAMEVILPVAEGNDEAALLRSLREEIRVL